MAKETPPGSSTAGQRGITPQPHTLDGLAARRAGGREARKARGGQPGRAFRVCGRTVSLSLKAAPGEGGVGNWENVTVRTAPPHAHSTNLGDRGKSIRIITLSESRKVKYTQRPRLRHTANSCSKNISFPHRALRICAVSDHCEFVWGGTQIFSAISDHQLALKKSNV